MSGTLDLKTPKTINLREGKVEEKRKEIRQYFHETFDVYEKLFEPLRSEEAYTARADPLRHPLIFYLGHTAVFFINKLVLARLLDKHINPAFESMFAVGVDEMSWDDLNDSHYDWPTSAAVMEYRKKVRQKIDEMILQMPLTLPISWDNPFWIIMMGIEHERIHLETSSVLIRQLPLELLSPHPEWQICEKGGEVPENSLLPVSEGEVVMGKEKEHPLYGWDNEYGHYEADVQAFKTSKYLVSNSEYLDFVNDGGYQDEQWWTEEGWKWAQYKKAEHPLFWVGGENGSYRYRAMLEIIDMPWNWPVEVNYLEAKAFCNWKSKKTAKTIRLLTEEEWYRLLDITETKDQLDWQQAPGNINLEYYASSCPVDRFKFGDFYDLMGNAWQWTENPISGFSGFEVHPLYDDFSTPTFDTKHNLIKGGSWISTGNEATRHSRYAFRRHFFQHAGFRYVESETPVVMRNDVYETDPIVAENCEFHYGDDYFEVENYPEKIAQISLAAMQGREKKKALNIGCKVGRSTFELAVEFDLVTGLDATARNFKIAMDMKDKGYTLYALPKEGEIQTFHERRLTDHGLDGVRNKVEFFQADVSNLIDRYKGYDLILVDNIIDRIYNPVKFLDAVHLRVNLGGLLILSSSYDWREEYTERKHWIGGFKEAGENVTTLDGLKHHLEPNFKLLTKPKEVPYVIRERERQFQHCVAEVTIWERINKE
jgi:5-histidylcysteine sulfoxide synthase/putative 4-mercaptohistidine N1-methyltranferase